MKLSTLFSKKSEKLTQETEAAVQRNENKMAGTIGAFLGTIIGVVVIVILGQLGYIASISGVIMAVCALKGYELLGGKLSKIGIMISSILILIMIYVGCRLDWAMSLRTYYEVDIFTAFQAVNNEYIEISMFLKDLLMLYLFGLMGAVPIIKEALQSKKNETIPQEVESDNKEVNNSEV